jgi:hypothetical protein
MDPKLHHCKNLIKLAVKIQFPASTHLCCNCDFLWFYLSQSQHTSLHLLTDTVNTSVCATAILYHLYIKAFFCGSNWKQIAVRDWQFYYFPKTIPTTLYSGLHQKFMNFVDTDVCDGNAFKQFQALSAPFLFPSLTMVTGCVTTHLV